jgi:gliding motility-associated-like protein
MKKQFTLLPLLLLCSVCFANHITGGEMYYTLVSQSGNQYTYNITLKLYRDCYAPAGSAQLDPSVLIGIYTNQSNSSNGQGAYFTSVSVQQSRFEKQNLGSPNPCISNPPLVCYEVGYYTFTTTLPASAYGYTVSYQRCCRITAINNLMPNSNQYGATYTAQIPGTNAASNGPVNNSAKFIGVDTVVVCANNYFCYNFGAADSDRDVLRYSFCSAYVGGSQGNSVPVPGPNSNTAPAYNSVPYRSPFNASQPLGAGVTIDPKTGLMCGIAPDPGIYVVTVCVDEIRNGVRIATQRKDLQIKVGDCNVAKAVPAIFDINGVKVRPEVAGCRSFTYTFANDVPPNPLIRTYYWEFSDGARYTEANPRHTFADTGVYTIKLVINRGEDCGDSSTATLRVYPGFFSGFVFNGICANKPTRFTDTTTTRYGVVNSWRWDFGNTAEEDDTSRLRNPTYTFPGEGDYNVQFIVSTNKGCVDTIRKMVSILTKPPLSVAFKDTLICNGDSLQLHAIGSGNFTWTPTSQMINAATADPTVFPSRTTEYVVRLDDQGCINYDTLQVRVVNFVTLRAMPDTVICAGDVVQLSAASDGLRFLWSPAATIVDDPAQKSPLARPSANTTYTVQAIIGGCVSTDDVNVSLVPYPLADAGADTSICYNTPAQLVGRHNGSSFFWSPTATLTAANTLTPVARPKSTTAYVLSSFDTRGCPKPGRDTVLVIVNPEVIANAGRDTAVVVGQPLQFNATGGEGYTWEPGESLSNASIAAPVGLYDGSFDSIRYFVTVRDAIGCSDETTVLVKIYKSSPRVFVPTAFTPNGDGRNDVLRPIAVGLTKLEYFRVYNRWGQLVFETTINGKGWDGKIKGVDQGSGTFVWIVRGQDFLGKVVFDKGTVTLIR